MKREKFQSLKGERLGILTWKFFWFSGEVAGNKSSELWDVGLLNNQDEGVTDVGIALVIDWTFQGRNLSIDGRFSQDSHSDEVENVVAEIKQVFTILRGKIHESKLKNKIYTGCISHLGMVRRDNDYMLSIIEKIRRYESLYFGIRFEVVFWIGNCGMRYHLCCTLPPRLSIWGKKQRRGLVRCSITPYRYPTYQVYLYSVRGNQ